MRAQRPQHRALVTSRRRSATALGVGVDVRVDARSPGLHILFACPVPPRGNDHLGGRTTAHWSGRASLAAEQRVRTRCAVMWQCARCEQPATALRLSGKEWAHALAGCLCSPRSAIGPRRLPPMGPEHPVDVLLVRVRKPLARALDSHDGLRQALKSVVDGLTEALWQRDTTGRLVGKPNDSAPWLRFSYAERPRRGEKPPSPSKRPADYQPGPPDPPAETELVELAIARREDELVPAPAVLGRWERGEL